MLLPDGTWLKPALFGVLDDHSRLCCHGQFYREEATETLVHGLVQAILKRGLPRAILMDNGGAMLGQEPTEGLYARFGLEWNPFTPDAPTEALCVTRVGAMVRDGGLRRERSRYAPRPRTVAGSRGGRRDRPTCLASS